MNAADKALLKQAEVEPSSPYAADFEYDGKGVIDKTDIAQFDKRCGADGSALKRRPSSPAANCGRRSRGRPASERPNSGGSADLLIDCNSWPRIVESSKFGSELKARGARFAILAAQRGQDVDCGVDCRGPFGFREPHNAGRRHTGGSTGEKGGRGHVADTTGKPVREGKVLLGLLDPPLPFRESATANIDAQGHYRIELAAFTYGTITRPATMRLVTSFSFPGFGVKPGGSPRELGRPASTFGSHPRNGGRLRSSWSIATTSR